MRLDRVSESIPVCLFHTSGHMGVVNTALLKLAGLAPVLMQSFANQGELKLDVVA